MATLSFAGDWAARGSMDASRFSPLGDVVFVEKSTQGIVVGVGDEKFRADVLRPDLLRLKISQAGRFDDSPTFATSFQEPSAPP
ncbi:MAG: alpha-glucosidase, partial [Myxococcales bacterium]|nr:alpha-glucosidase [Myxococcales bacterium]